MFLVEKKIDKNDFEKSLHFEGGGGGQGQFGKSLHFDFFFYDGFPNIPFGDTVYSGGVQCTQYSCGVQYTWSGQKSLLQFKSNTVQVN